MMVVLDAQAPEELVQALCAEIGALGGSFELSRGSEETVIALSGPMDRGQLEAALAGRPGVELLDAAETPRSWVERSRRRFVGGLIAGFGLLTAALAGMPVVAFLLPPRRPLAQPDQVQAARVGQIPENSAKLLRFRGRPVLLVHETGGRYRAVSAVCTHMNVCQVEWDPSRRLLLCPCHGGAFDLHGNVVSGPPPRPLPSYAVKVQGGHIYIQREV